MKIFPELPPVHILFCNRCHGTGWSGIARCPKCHGYGAGRFIRQQFFYWGEPFTRYHLTWRNARKWLNRFEILGGVVFGLGFLALFVWFMWPFVHQLDIFLSIHFWIHPHKPYVALVWLSLISWSYLLYRVIASQRHPELVEFNDYQKEDTIASVQPNEISETWKYVKTFSRKKKHDISLTFTNNARSVLADAFRVADSHNSTKVLPVHIFYALLSSIRIGNIFIRMGVPVKYLQAHLAKQFVVDGNAAVAPELSHDVEEILFHAYDLAYEARQEYTHVTELLVATVYQSESIQELLYDLKIDKDKLANVVEWLRIRERLTKQYKHFRKAAARRSKHGIDRAMTAVATPYLNSFSQDLTLAAKFGYLAPCVAREKEIEEIFRIIEAGRESVVLVGDSGVGKMSIIEGIAQKMVEEDVPKQLSDKRLVQLSVPTLLAGTTISGAGQRLINIMREVGQAKNIILVIKNISDLVSVSESKGQSGFDVAKTLAEYLGPGGFITLATTNSVGYNRFIANGELASVLSKVNIAEMQTNQAIQVLESKVGSIEYRHNVFFAYDAIATSVQLSERLLHDQRLPESAIGILTEAASYVKKHKGKNTLVNAEDVGAVVSEKTGVPTASITEDESSKLMRLEQSMHERIVGQNEAVSLVANALRRARANIRSKNRPIATFLFLGPTGVGKTELAKTIASVYFGGEQLMIRIDMSEYQTKSSLYRLIGQPGQQGTGLLTEAVHKQPFSLVLLDELEKADSDVLNVFLQVFDDGRLTDSVGRVIDFKNTIIIATSNAGTQYVQDEVAKGTELEKIRQQLVHAKLKQYYRPEFLNRFDGIILFKPLTRDEIKQIAGLMLKRVEADLGKQGVFLRVEDAALDALADVGFDPEFGARPMRRAIQDHIENKLAELVLQNSLNRRDTVVLGQGGEIHIEPGK